MVPLSYIVGHSSQPWSFRAHRKEGSDWQKGPGRLGAKYVIGKD